MAQKIYTDSELIDEVLLRLGIKKPLHSVDFMATCPLHSDKKPSMGVNIEKGVYHCFSCGSTGTIISLYKKATGVDILKELNGFRQGINIFSKINNRTIFQNMDELPESHVALSETNVVPVSASQEAMAYLKKRGISLKTAEEIGIKYSYMSYTFNPDNPTDKSQWILYKSRIIIPIKEKDKKRSTDTTSFFKTLSVEGRDILGKEEFEKSKKVQIARYLASPTPETKEKIESLNNAVYRKVLYPKCSSTSTLFQLDNLDTQKTLYFVEGLMDLCVLREDSFFKNSTAIFGATITQRQQYFLQKFRDIVYIADHDLAGLRSIKKLKEQLEKPFKILFAPNGCKDVGDIPQVLHTTVEDCRVNRNWICPDNFISSDEFNFKEQCERSTFITPEQREMLKSLEERENKMSKRTIKRNSN